MNKHFLAFSVLSIFQFSCVMRHYFHVSGSTVVPVSVVLSSFSVQTERETLAELKKKLHIQLEVRNFYLMDSITRSLPASVTGNQAQKSIHQASPQLRVFWPAQERWGTFPERQTTYPLSPPLMSASVCPGCSPDSEPGEFLLTHLTRHIQWGIRNPFFSYLSVPQRVSPVYLDEARVVLRAPLHLVLSGPSAPRQRLRRRSKVGLQLRLQWGGSPLRPEERHTQQV